MSKQIEPVVQFPTSVEEVPEERNVTQGLAFLGGCGGNNALLFMNTIDPELYPHVRVFIGNTDGPHLKWVKSEMKKTPMSLKWQESGRVLILELGDLKGRGAGGNTEVGAKALELMMDKVRSEFLEGLDSLVIGAGAGGGTGGGGVSVLAKAAKNEGITTLVFLTMPSRAEGGRRIKRANMARDNAFQIVPTVVLHNENVLSQNPTLTPKASWAIINSCLVLSQVTLRELSQQVAQMINSDMADWKTVLDEGHYVYFGYAEVGETFNGEEVFEALLGNKWQNSEIVRKASAVQLWFHGCSEGKAWMNQEWLAVVERVRKRMGINPQEEADDEIHIGLYEGDDEKKWVALIAVAKEPPSLDAPITEREEPRADRPRIKSEEVVNGVRTFVTMDQEWGEMWRKLARSNHLSGAVLMEMEKLLPKLDARDLTTNKPVRVELPKH